MMSAASTVIIPIRDILGQGGEACMNNPTTREGNWEYRLLPDGITSSLVDRLREMVEIYWRI